MQKLLLVIVALVALSIAQSLFDSKSARTEFATWARRYNKVYSQEEHQARYNIWLKNSAIIRELKQQNPAARYGHNKFGDLSPEEFSKIYLTKLNRPAPVNQPQVKLDFQVPLPTEFDWRSRNAVTPVKDQGDCGSCWAFSVVETIESQWFLAGHTLVELSPQQIVDCDVGRGDQGCNGGDTPTAYQYVIAAGGLDTEKQYPYTAQDGTCSFVTPVAAKIRSWKYITKTKNETEMQVGLVQNGPLSICVDASSWQFYQGGVITNRCGHNLDHCVQITGFRNQTVSGTTYNVWNVRNSWGLDWGEQGYLSVERNKDLCGIALEVTIPIV